MDKKTAIKWVVLAGLVCGALAVIWPPKDKIPLGLDLKGGLSFTVQIDEDAIRGQILEEAPDLSAEQVAGRLPEALQKAQERALEVIRNRVDGMGIAEPMIYPERGNRIVVQLPGIDSNKVDQATRSLQSAAFLEFRLVHAQNRELVKKLFDAGQAPEGYTIETVSDSTGRSDEYFVRARDFNEAQVDEAYRSRLARFNAPPGYELMLERNEINGRKVYTPCFVSRKAELDGTALRQAKVEYRGLSEPVVAIQFNKPGARKFHRLTTDFAPNGPRNPNSRFGRQLAIILDGTLYSAPSINEPIAGGNAEISGRFTPEEAYFLANVLKAGALPAPVTIVEKRLVSPSLGQDAVESGIRASLIGLAAIAVFMLLYYRLAGVVAITTLVFNMLLLPLGMLLVAGTLGVLVKEARAGNSIALPVLTLPGLAGIVLTIGMAVDANVLIFERIREELKSGKQLAAAIAAGFERAFTAIFDSNVTTILTALVLFIFGSGPIRGYAVTLAAGLTVSLYTSVLVGRMLLDLVAKKTTRPEALTMTALVPFTKIDFISKGRIAIILSSLVIVLTLGWMAVNGFRDPTRVFAMDFTGGSSVTLAFTEKVPVEDLRASLEQAGVSQAFIQYQTDTAAAGRELLLVKSSVARDEVVSADEKIGSALRDSFPQAGFSVTQADFVGPQVGNELKGKAVMAMLFSLLIMIVYISWRFEFGFALGAVVALLHDALFTLGVVYLCGKQINLTVVAALMTIIGYSVNDTIVIFDRIREDIKLVRGKSFVELCNLSLNQTLSRTLLTSLTTLLAVSALVLFGGGAINDFALTMLIGVLVGCYSTIYIATPIVLAWYRYKTPDFSKK